MFDSFHGFLLCILGFFAFLYAMALIPFMAWIVFGFITLYLMCMVGCMIYFIGRFIYSIVYYLITKDKKVLEWV